MRVISGVLLCLLLITGCSPDLEDIESETDQEKLCRYANELKDYNLRYEAAARLTDRQCLEKLKEDAGSSEMENIVADRFAILDIMEKHYELNPSDRGVKGEKEIIGDRTNLFKVVVRMQNDSRVKAYIRRLIENEKFLEESAKDPAALAIGMVFKRASYPWDKIQYYSEKNLANLPKKFLYLIMENETDPYDLGSYALLLEEKERMRFFKTGNKFDLNLTILKTITDPDLLYEIACNEEILSNFRIMAIMGLTEPLLAEFVLNSQKRDLATEAFSRIKGQDALKRIATETAVPEFRQMAIEQIDDDLFLRQFLKKDNEERTWAILRLRYLYAVNDKMTEALSLPDSEKYAWVLAIQKKTLGHLDFCRQLIESIEEKNILVEIALNKNLYLDKETYIEILKKLNLPIVYFKVAKTFNDNKKALFALQKITNKSELKELIEHAESKDIRWMASVKLGDVDVMIEKLREENEAEWLNRMALEYMRLTAPVFIEDYHKRLTSLRSLLFLLEFQGCMDRLDFDLDVRSETFNYSGRRRIIRDRLTFRIKDRQGRVFFKKSTIGAEPEWMESFEENHSTLNFRAPIHDGEAAEAIMSAMDQDCLKKALADKPIEHLFNQLRIKAP